MSLPHWFDRFRMPVTVVEFALTMDADPTPQSIDQNGKIFVQRMAPTAEDRSENPDARRRNGYQSPFRIGMERGYKWEIDAGDGITVTASQVESPLEIVLTASPLATTSHSVLGICGQGGRLCASSMGD